MLLNTSLHSRIVEKKNRLDSLRPLNPSIVHKLQEQMEIKYTYNSNHIEGNTLTLKETQLLLEEGLTVHNKPLPDVLEIKNHPEAIDYIETIAKKIELKEVDILTIHQIIKRGVDDDAGRYRSGHVIITGSSHIPPPAYEIQFLIPTMIAEYNRNPNELVPIELAAWLHYRFVNIHPFNDGNGRVARLLMNLTLIRYGYPMTVISYSDRRQYYNTLDKADKGNLVPFVNFVASSVEQMLDTYLRAIEPTKEPLIPISEASKGTPYSAEYLSLLSRMRAIPATKEGKTWLVTKSMIEQYAKAENPSYEPKGKTTLTN